MQFVHACRGIHKPIVPVIHDNAYFMMDGTDDELLFDVPSQMITDRHLNSSKHYNNTAVMEIIMKWQAGGLVVVAKMHV